jgi:ABC-type multidrug transport system fused ATPase/permease subunit
VRTEEEILRELLPRVRDKTVVLVSHRLATASLADRICILESGKIAGIGEHDELARENTEYRRLLQAAQMMDESRRLRMLEVT